MRKLLVATALIAALIAGPVLAQDTMSPAPAATDTTTAAPAKTTSTHHAKKHTGKKKHAKKSTTAAPAAAPAAQ